MVHLPKSELIPLIADYFRTQLQESTYQIYQLSQKYNCTFAEFEDRIQKKTEEDFGEWEDYILWKGHMKSAHYLSGTIQSIEDGLFTLT